MSTSSGRLRIGVSCNFLHADPERAIFKGKTLQYVEERMARSVFRAGGVPYPLVDLGDRRGAEAVLEHVHGLVLSGGADVSPRSYGEVPLDERWSGDFVRDRYERRLVEVALDMGLPILGLCRGIQLLNVALGGTLWQDIETQRPGSLVHRDWHRYDELNHTVRIEPESWLARIYGGGIEQRVNTVHHQALKDVASRLRVTASAPDGIVEAVEWIDDEVFAVGVQWHPEWLEAEQVAPGRSNEGFSDGDRIFFAFAEVCSARARARGRL